MDQRDKYMNPNNPTYEERLRMLKIALEEANHVEDYNNLVEGLSPPCDITTINSVKNCKGIKVGIIGGGIAGLVSAFELRKLGFNITIIETDNNRIGGRIYTHYFDKEKKLYGELGAMRIPISHEMVWHYIDLFKLKTRRFIQNNDNSFIYVRNKRARNDPKGQEVMDKIYPEFKLTSKERRTSWQDLIAYALSDNLFKLDLSTRKELIEVKEKYSDTIDYLDNLNILDVFEKMGLSEGAIEMLSGVYSFLGNFYYNNYLEYLTDEYTVNYAYRYEIVDGFAKLPEEFYNSLMNKNPKEYPNIKKENLGRVIYEAGKTVIGIYKEDGNKRVILKCQNEKTLEIKKEEFDFVISTIPFSSLRNIEVYPMFSTEKMQAIKELNYAPAQKTILLCKERFWERGNSKEKIIGGASYTDEVIGSIWYRVYSNSKKNNKGVLVASYNLNQDAVRLGNLEEHRAFELTKRQVENVHGLKKGELDKIVEGYKRILWDKKKGHYGGVCYSIRGQRRLFLYQSFRSEYNGRVYFAGEHVSTYHGWIQGAISSALKATNDIAKNIGENFEK